MRHVFRRLPGAALSRAKLQLQLMLGSRRASGLSIRKRDIRGEKAHPIRRAELDPKPRLGPRKILLQFRLGWCERHEEMRRIKRKRQVERVQNMSARAVEWDRSQGKSIRGDREGIRAFLYPCIAEMARDAAGENYGRKRYGGETQTVRHIFHAQMSKLAGALARSLLLMILTFTSSGTTSEPGGTLWARKTFPPIVLPSPTTVSPPMMVAPA